jgi:hypothetical protein
MKTVRAHPLSETSLQMTSTDNSCVEFKNLRSKMSLKRMNGGKAMGPHEIPIEVWRTLGDVAIA